MSYQIYYDRAFIKVGDKFVPMVNSGSNNCWEVNFCNRSIPEKNWGVLNNAHYNKVLFTVDEIKEIAKRYEKISQDSGICYKTRNKCFEAGEFERWILGGMKSALTVEEYVNCGNVLYITARNEVGSSSWSVNSTDELLKKLNELNGFKSLDMEFEYNRQVFRPEKESKSMRIRKLGRYYALKLDSEFGSYFCSFRKNRITFCRTPDFEQARAFETEKDALRYLEKNKEGLSRYKLVPVLIEIAV